MSEAVVNKYTSDLRQKKKQIYLWYMYSMSSALSSIRKLLLRTSVTPIEKVWTLAFCVGGVSKTWSDVSKWEQDRKRDGNITGCWLILWNLPCTTYWGCWLLFIRFLSDWNIWVTVFKDLAQNRSNSLERADSGLINRHQILALLWWSQCYSMKLMTNNLNLKYDSG